MMDQELKQRLQGLQSLLNQIQAVMVCGRVEEWHHDMMRAVPDGLVRQIVNDHRGGPAKLAPLSSDQRGVVGQPEPGWIDAAPLGPPPGQAYIDQLCAAADAEDRVERLSKVIDVLKVLRSGRD
jgi:hypothetical protein